MPLCQLNPTNLINAVSVRKRMGTRIPVRADFLSLAPPLVEEEDIVAVTETLRSGWLTNGKKAQAFEEAFCTYTGIAHALATNSCTAALMLALNVLEVQADDEVIVPSMTWAATANVIVRSGAIPVFVDVEDGTHNLDPMKVEAAISPKTKVIMVVHMAGHPADMDEIMQIAKRHNLKVIEDCAHAIEATYKGKHVGTLGDVGCFSFYANKNMTTGEGGMLVSNNAELIKTARTRAAQGVKKKKPDQYATSAPYDIEYPGFKLWMSDVHASLGLNQFKRLDANLEKRNKIVQRYTEAFKECAELILPKEKENIKHARHLFRVELDLSKVTCSREEFIDALHELNIGTGTHYVAVHETTWYKNHFPKYTNQLPITEKISKQIVSLPLSPKMNENDVEDVIKAVLMLLDEFRKE